MTTKADGTLDAVLIAHLSASRRNLTLIAVPPDLMAPVLTATIPTSKVPAASANASAPTAHPGRTKATPS